jgi:phenylalanyl-tRNA synthetase alpha chain
MNEQNQIFSHCQSVSEVLRLRDELMKSAQFNDLKAKIARANPEQKKEIGAQLNHLKKELQTACDTRIKEIQTAQEVDHFVSFDPTFYSAKYREGRQGTAHPIAATITEIIGIFSRLGFDVYDGPQVLDQWNNFTSVNTPDYHPARDMQDTFFVDAKNKNGEHYVMRTQATSNFAEYAAAHRPPFRVIFPSITFRNENMDATHDINFHQFDLWMIDRSLSMSQLTTLMQAFFEQFFADPAIKIRIRPSFFPFVNPGFEADISLPNYKNGSWIEVCGAGLVHREVLSMAHIDPDEWQGIAWGFGIDRLCMIRHQLETVTSFYNGKLSFLRGTEHAKRP